MQCACVQHQLGLSIPSTTVSGNKRFLESISITLNQSVSKWLLAGPHVQGNCIMHSNALLTRKLKHSFHKQPSQEIKHNLTNWKVTICVISQLSTWHPESTMSTPLTLFIITLEEFMIASFDTWVWYTAWSGAGAPAEVKTDAGSPTVFFFKGAGLVFNLAWNLHVDSAVVHHVHGPLLMRERRYISALEKNIIIQNEKHGIIILVSKRRLVPYHYWNLVGWIGRVCSWSWDTSTAIQYSFPFATIHCDFIWF